MARVLHSFEASAQRCGEQGEACVLSGEGFRSLPQGARRFTGENPQGKPLFSPQGKPRLSPPGKPRLSLDRFVLACVHAHINQGEASAMAVGLNGNQVLVALGSYLQLDRVSASVISACDGLGHIILALVVYVARLHPTLNPSMIL